MIENTFCHVQGIGIKTEQQLWGADIRDWESFLQCPSPPLSSAKIKALTCEIEASRDALMACMPEYFHQRLKPPQQWRMFRDFRHKVAYIDIETTGLDFGDSITTIALYDGRGIRYYVQGDNLQRFIEDIFDYKLLVTYNGKCFDVPMIEGYFRTKLPHAHIDLRHLLNGLGYKGGLKRCEKLFGISRDGLDGVDGFFAVLLWREYTAKRNYKALETLLAYNIEDVVNLEYLMHQAYNLKVQETPFAAQLSLEIPPRPDVPFSADPVLVDRLRYRMTANSPW